VSWFSSTLSRQSATADTAMPVKGIDHKTGFSIESGLSTPSASAATAARLTARYCSSSASWPSKEGSTFDAKGTMRTNPEAGGREERRNSLHRAILRSYSPAGSQSTAAARFGAAGAGLWSAVCDTLGNSLARQTLTTAKRAPQPASPEEAMGLSTILLIILILLLIGAASMAA